MSNSLARGLYEALLTHGLASELRSVAEHLEPLVSDLRPAEAADRIALHLARVIDRGLASVADRDRVEKGIHIARDLLERLGSLLGPSDLEVDAPIEPGKVLHAIRAIRPDGRAEEVESPMIPLLDTTLLTNAPGEPRVGSQIRAEIGSADRIDLVMAFIRRSGVAPLTDALRRHCEEGRPFRVLTTTYTGSTELRALNLLRDLGAEIRVSYDASTTRLHAKAWHFHRRSGHSTAYIGSSNLTHSAQVTGLEWNVRLSQARNPDAVAKVASSFEGHWESADFLPYDEAQFREQAAQPDRTSFATRLSPLEVRLDPFQEWLLEEVALSRSLGHRRNLLVPATGTGKTVMAAVDYARVQRALERSRLLYVAHREQILEQSREIFRHVLRDATFGEMWVGGISPGRFEHVFASIQTLASQGLRYLDPAHFDVVIVDEFHHAAAPSYEALLEHVKPQELLGLTATPERSDGLSVLHYFDERIAAELRLWDAIDQHHLSPFVYYGVHDGLDLSEIPWRRGRGYDVEGLTKLYTANDAWARRVIAQVEQRAENIGRMRALGFCVSVEHARFMARVFGEAGLSAVAVWADSSPEEPADALGTLRDGGLRGVFSVDLFNEGVDVPVVDTLLLLRPTDSPTLFLQQLGRGLRRAENKNVCTVLDFVGHHRKEFRLDRRFRALLGGTRKQLERQIAEGFPFLPAGCHMELDRVAEEIVLRNIRESLPSRWEGKVEELRSLAATSGAEVSLARFLDETGFELEEVYAAGRSWSDLMESAGLAVAPAGPQEKQLRRACGRMLHVDDSYVGRRSRTSSPATDRSSLTSARERLTSTMIAQTLDSRPFIQLVWPERKHGGSIRRAYRRSRPRPPDRRLPIGGLLCHPRPG